MQWPLRRAVVILLCVGALGCALHAADTPAAKPSGLIRIGDPGSEFDASKADERFPEMAEWAKAGVEGGIPDVQRIVATVKPGDDLAAAILKADTAPKNLGVLLLEPGEYPLAATLALKPGLILRGKDRQKTILASNLTGGTCIKMAAWSALEDLTALNTHTRDAKEADYIGKYSNGGPSTACTVWFGGSNAWIQRCDILYAGKNPVEIHNGKAAHITVRDTLVDKAYNKGGGGAGYFDISESKHILIYNCIFKNIRHVSIMFNAEFVVLYGCHFEVDVNYHDGAPKRTLLENCTSKPRAGHHWGAMCWGWEPWQRLGPGERNFIYRFDAPAVDGTSMKDDTVYVLRDTTPGFKNMTEIKPMLLTFGPAPKGGTLYAVTGKHVKLEELELFRQQEVAAAEKAKAAEAAKKAAAEKAVKVEQAKVEADATAQLNTLATLMKARLAQKQPIVFESTTLKSKAEIRSVNEKEQFALEGGGLSLNLAIKSFSAHDRFLIARQLVRKDAPETYDLAIFFAEAASRTKDAEALRLERAQK